MAFTEAGEDKQIASGGLKLNWKNLENGDCPICGDRLEEFKHIRMFKCGCGFKISESRYGEILKGDFKPNSGRGYNVGDYYNEPPF